MADREYRTAYDTRFWNERMILSSKIEEIVKPFLELYQLRPDQIEIKVAANGGIYIKTQI